MNGPDHRFRRSLRLESYDYSQAGAYYVTVCAHDRACILVRSMLRKCGSVKLGEPSNLVGKRFRSIFKSHWTNGVVMPNHLHGIIVITDDPDVGMVTPQLGLIVGAFKSAATKRV